jgi:vacuolar-type H+-ATPase catalytic subunit A/Vma1
LSHHCNFAGGVADQTKLQWWDKQYMTTKPSLQMILQGVLHTEDESKQIHERMGTIKLQEKKRQVLRMALI